MPEVYCMVDSLSPKLKGERIISLIIKKESPYYDKKMIPGLKIESWNELLDKSPASFIDEGIILDIDEIILDMYAYGKKIVIVLETIVIVSSLGMEGKWIFDEKKHTLLIMKFKNFDLFYDDSRHFGNFEIHFKDIFKLNIGPDYFKGGITWEIFKEEILRHPRMKIDSFLLDQNIFSGVGNYIKCDSLYLSHIHPDNKIANIDKKRLKKLFLAIIQIATSSYKAQGATIKSYHDSNGKKGNFEFVIYGKKIDPYGNKVIKIDGSKDRQTYIVEDVQY